MNFNPNESSLHLLFREDTFKYCIVSEKNTIVSLKTFHENNLDTLKTLFSEQNELNQSYKKVRVSVYDPNRTLVPVDFFDFNELEILYAWQDQSNISGKLLYDFIEPINYYNIYQIDTHLFDFVRSQYPRSLFQSSTSILIDRLLLEDAEEGTSQVYMSLGSSYMEVAVVANGTLQFTNSFFVQTAEDILYYLMSTIEEGKIDLMEDEIFLMDNFEKVEQFGVLKNYLASLQEAKLNAKYELDGSLSIKSVCHHDILSI